MLTPSVCAASEMQKLSITLGHLAPAPAIASAPCAFLSTPWHQHEFALSSPGNNF